MAVGASAQAINAPVPAIRMNDARTTGGVIARKGNGRAMKAPATSLGASTRRMRPAVSASAGSVLAGRRASALTGTRFVARVRTDLALIRR